MYFLRFGCGNSIHIKCMKVWAEHQKSQGETIVKCPFCREDFGPFEMLKVGYACDYFKFTILFSLDMLCWSFLFVILQDFITFPVIQTKSQTELQSVLIKAFFEHSHFFS